MPCHSFHNSLTFYWAIKPIPQGKGRWIMQSVRGGVAEYLRKTVKMEKEIWDKFQCKEKRLSVIGKAVCRCLSFMSGAFYWALNIKDQLEQSWRLEILKHKNISSWGFQVFGVLHAEMKQVPKLYPHPKVDSCSQKELSHNSPGHRQAKNIFRLAELSLLSALKEYTTSAIIALHCN